METRYKPCGSDGCCYTDDREYVERLKNVLNDFVAEYCDREGDEDLPKPAHEQDSLVASAMRLLDI